MSLQDARIEALIISDAPSGVTTAPEVRLSASSQSSVFFTDKTHNTPNSRTDDLDSSTAEDTTPAPAQYAPFAATTPLTIEYLAEHERHINIRVEEEEQSEQAEFEQLRDALESLGVDLADSAILRMLSRHDSLTALECLLVKEGTSTTGGDGSESMADTIVL